VEVPTAHFALRLAMFELDRLLKNGLSEEDFQASRNFLSKYVNLLTKTKSAELGYAIDSRFYGISDFNSYIRGGLAKLTRADVNRAIGKHLSMDRMVLAIVAQDAEKLKEALVSNAESPMSYNSPKPEALVAEDKIVQKWPVPLKAEAVRIVPVETVFE
jgi:zinc protease